jgi:hypothetical protein
MSNIEFATISSSDLSFVAGGQNGPQPAPQQPAQPPAAPRPTPAQDAINMVTSGADLFTGARSIRQTVNGAQSGWSKGTSLPASNAFERFRNGVGGAVIDGLGLGW